MYEDRIRRPALMNKLMSADQAALLFKAGMTVGMSGFTRAGDAKALPAALVERARQGPPLQLSLLTGASLGNESDGMMANAGDVCEKRQHRQGSNTDSERHVATYCNDQYCRP